MSTGGQLALALGVPAPERVRAARVRVGDELQLRDHSGGRVARYRIVEVRHCWTPVAGGTYGSRDAGRWHAPVRRRIRLIDHRAEGWWSRLGPEATVERTDRTCMAPRPRRRPRLDRSAWHMPRPTR